MARIVIIQNIKAEFPGVMCISSVLKKHNHECYVVISTKVSDYIKFLRETNPHLIGFSPMSGMQQWAVRSAKEIKKEFPESKIVFGGVHPTYFPEVIEEEPVDIICRGEGEYAILDLMDAIDRNENITKIKNLWVKHEGKIYKNELRPLIENLDELPFMDRELYYDRYPFLKNRRVKYFIEVRGCPYDCTFCFNHKLKSMYKGKGSYVRFRSKEKIIEEVLQVKRTYGLKRVQFIADTMFINKKWAMDFLKEYKDRAAIPFTCVIRADMLDEEVVKELKDSGCVSVWFGLESGDEQMRNIVLSKNLSNNQIIQSAAMLRKYGIKFRAFCMMCLPGETIKQAYDTINLNIKIKTDYPHCCIYNPYAGTKLVEYAKGKGFLDQNFDINSLDVSYYKRSVLKNEKNNELLNIQRFFQTAVLFPKTLSIIKKLVKLPPNPIFDIWFLFIYSIIHLKAEGHGLRDRIIFGLDCLKVFYHKNK